MHFTYAAGNLKLLTRDVRKFLAIAVSILNFLIPYDSVRKRLQQSKNISSTG